MSFKISFFFFFYIALHLFLNILVFHIYTFFQTFMLHHITLLPVILFSRWILYIITASCSGFEALYPLILRPDDLVLQSP